MGVTMRVLVLGGDGFCGWPTSLYLSNPGSVYHMTKALDQLMFALYAKNDGLRIADLHQGIVWGTQTDQTAADERLINRFDYDGDYGTVRNDHFLALGLRPTLLCEGPLTDVREVAARYAHRADLRKIISRSVWRAGLPCADDLVLAVPRARRLPRSPEPGRLRPVPLPAEDHPRCDNSQTRFPADA